MPACQLTFGQWLYILGMAVAEAEDLTPKNGAGSKRSFVTRRKQPGAKAKP